jgi:hypothetical protein
MTPIVKDLQGKKDQLTAITYQPCDHYYLRIQNPHIGGAATKYIQITEAQLEKIRQIVTEDG